MLIRTAIRLLKPKRPVLKRNNFIFYNLIPRSGRKTGAFFLLIFAATFNLTLAGARKDSPNTIFSGDSAVW